MRSDPPDAKLLVADAALSHQLLDTAPDAIVVLDEQGVIVLVNLQTERLFGFARDELLGKKIEVLIPERFRNAHIHHRTGFVAKPRARPMGTGLELFGRKRDGSEFFVEISLSPLHTQDRTLTSASIRDISERKQTELRIGRVQEHLLSAVESIQGGFAIFNAQDYLVQCNTACRELLGRHVPGEIVGRTLAELMSANLTAHAFDVGVGSVAAFQARWAAYHRAPIGGFDLRTRAGRSLRWVERRTSEGGTVTTIIDVTDDVQHEVELRAARAAAEAANSAKSEFLASMSHELRTPLNAILGFAQLLQRDQKLPLADRHRERVEHVIRGGEHLLRLIDDVLDLSRVEAGRVTVSLEPVDVVETLMDARSTLQPMAARAEIELSVAPLAAALPLVIADRMRFKQILMNYGSNAIKYGRKGGKVIFKATMLETYVRISFEDDGVGIPRDKQDKIFQPFQRAGQETGPIEGTGIGLAISKRLAELMEGRVGFRSTEASGSEFWIELPGLFHEANNAVREPRVRDNPSSRLEDPQGPRYLVVYIEDNPSNIALMADLLADFERVELVTAPTAEIGLELVRARQPNVVVMDVHLPGISGFEATRRLHEWQETKHIPVIALSAAAMARDAVDVKNAGFYRYLTKPVKVDELSSVLEELLTNGKPI